MKLKVFISSRNNDRIHIGGKEGDNLTEVRIWLRQELENIKVFGKDFLSIRINETFGASTERDSYNECLEEVRKSDLIIALYNGTSGWAPDGSEIGICHSELAIAMNISQRKTAIINIENFFKITGLDKKDLARDDKFKKYIQVQNRFMNPLKVVGKQTNENFKKSLLDSIKSIIYNNLTERINISNNYYNFSDNNKISLDWKKLKYRDRDKLIKDKLNKIIISSPDFSKFITKSHSIPDNMSVNDAQAYTGRPFLNDQKSIDSEKKNVFGPLHFIGVYGRASEIQVKKLIGFPDITVVKDDFGLYVWEQNTHIQLVFFVNCRTPEAIDSNFLLFNNWCRSSDEFENIKKRAKARIHILKAINQANQITIQ